MARFPYAREYRQLIEYQENQAATVLFQLYGEPGGEPMRIFIRAVSDGGAARVIVELRNLEPFGLWQNFGYIRVVTGGVGQHGSTFRLTERGIESAKKG